MKVSELARLAGTAPSAVRWYEAVGVLPPAGRMANGYRAYGDADLARLRLVVALRRLGLAPVEAGRLAALCLEHGAIDRALPFIRREVVKVLRAQYPSKDAALTGIAEGLTGYYASNHPAAPAASVKQAVGTAQALYQRNVFPAMNVTWASYVNNVGHTAFPGCFRCHDDQHVTKDGKTISQDCSLCHTME